MRIWWLVVLLAVSCALPPPEAAESQEEPDSPAAPQEPALTATTGTAAQPAPAQGGAIPGTVSRTATGRLEYGGLTICDIGVEIAASQTAVGVHVEATAVNTTDRPIVLALANGCAGGPVQLEGLPAGFDPYQTCAHACDPSRPATVSVQVGPGARVPITQFDIVARSSCQAQLVEGKLYWVSATLPASATPGREVCRSSQVMVGIIGGIATMR